MTLFGLDLREKKMDFMEWEEYLLMRKQNQTYL